MDLLHRGLLGSLLWLLAMPALAQVEPIFRSLDVADGLPSSKVPSLIQDHRGLIWIATEDGLASYDGVDFRVFRHDPADPQSLPCNEVQTVFEDRAERLWVGCSEAGLVWLSDRQHGHFQQFMDQDGGSLDVFNIVEQADGQLLLATYQKGVLRFDPTSGQFVALHKVFPALAPLARALVLELLIDAHGDLWVADLDGIWRLRGADAATARLEHMVAGDLGITLYQTRDNAVWFGLRDGLYRIPAGAEQNDLQRIDGEFPMHLVDSMVEDREGTLWVGANGGLTLLTPGRKPQQIVARSALAGSLPESRVEHLVVDREGGMWLGLRSKGIAYVRPDWRNFSLLRHDPLRSDSLPAGRLMDLAVCPDGQVWAVNQTGQLVRIGPDGQVSRWRDGESAVAVGDSSQSLHCASDGQLWVGFGRGLIRVDPATAQRRTFDHDHDGIAPGNVNLIKEDHAGAIWLAGLGNGISRIERVGRVRTWQTPEDGISAADFEQIRVAADGSVWLATVAGMLRYQPASDRFEPPVGGLQERVFAFTFDRDGALWTYALGALDCWILQPDGSLRPRQHIGQDRGLPAVEMSSLEIDEQGSLWLFGSRGLWRIDPDTARVTAIDSRFGLGRLQFDILPSAERVGGALINVAIEGFLRFEPKNLISVDDVPELSLIGARIKDGDRRRDLDLLAPAWQLDWDDRDLQVEARVLAFADPRANHYRFRLRGYDSDWVDTGARPVREFSRIPPGNYQLEVSGSSAGGISAPAPLVKTLRVAEPPWQSPLAYLAYALLVALLLGSAFGWYRGRLEQRHHLELTETRRQDAERASLAKSDFLADVGHEIRTPIAGLLGMTELLGRSPLDPDQRRWVISIKRSGEHMQQLINDLLDLSRIEVGMLSVEREPVELRVLIEEVRALEAPLAAARGIGFTVAIADQVPAAVWGDSRRLRQIVLNLVNNALKFTEHGAVTVALAVADRQLLISVSDTGPGMDDDEVARLFARYRQSGSGRRHGGSGLGLAISDRLAHLLGGRITVQSAPGHGSRFEVTLPFEVAEVPAQPVIDPHPPLRERPLEGIGVLLVEDDASIREAIAAMLATLGADVDAVMHGLDALARFRPGAHRLLLLDLDLPGIDGFTLLGLLRSRAGSAASFAVAVTARSESDIEQHCRQAGFDRFLRKPLSATTLAAAASEWRPLV